MVGFGGAVNLFSVNWTALLDMSEIDCQIYSGSPNQHKLNQGEPMSYSPAKQGFYQWIHLTSNFETKDCVRIEENRID